MKAGKTLKDLAAELKRQHEAAKDYLSPTAELAMGTDGRLKVGDVGTFDVSQYAHGQIADTLRIPRRYYERMRSEAPELLAENVNLWMPRHPISRMVRTMDGRVRAVLSDRYRPLDNFDLANVVLAGFADAAYKVESAEVTDLALYIKVVMPNLKKPVAVGDLVTAGVVVSNSEVGAGSLLIEPMIYRLACTNGLIVPDHSMRQFHVGRGHGDMDGASEYFRDDTRKADDAAFWLKVRDAIAAAISEERFERHVRRFVESKTIDVVNPSDHEGERASVTKVVEVVGKRFGLTEGEGESVLEHLVRGGDLSAFGVVNAITRASQDVEDYDRATDLERTGGRVLELKRSDWARIAKQAAAL